MTDEEYYEIIATFKPNFTPTSYTCGKYSNSSCGGCTFYNSYVDYCGLYIDNPIAVLPSFKEKVVKLNPEAFL